MIDTLVLDTSSCLFSFFAPLTRTSWKVNKSCTGDDLDGDSGGEVGVYHVEVNEPLEVEGEYDGVRFLFR